MPDDPAPNSNLLRNLAISCGLVLMTYVAYCEVPNLEFVYFDDPGYVLDNLHVQKGLFHGAFLENIHWGWTNYGEQSNWHPLTWWSHMIDVDIFGFENVNQPKSGGPHVVNLLFHIANTLLLFFLLKAMTRAAWRSAVVAALFAVHPMHVESVAWVAERKDLLSTFFELLTIGAYLWYVRSLKRTAGRPWEERIPLGVASYVPVFLLFAVTLLAKPMPATLPFLLLLLDYWPLDRLTLRSVLKQHAAPRKEPEMSRAAKAKLARNRPWVHRQEVVRSREWRWEQAAWLVLEKVPLLALTLVSCFITYGAQQKGASMAKLESLPFALRMSTVLTAYVRYIGGMLWPFDLTMFYPYVMRPSEPYVRLAAVLLLMLTIAALVGAYYGRRYLPVGWFWFLGTLVPVIGLVQVGDQSMADRYSYFTFTGLFIILVWGLTDLFGRWPEGRAVLGAAAAAVLGGCVLLTVKQVDYWHDTIAALEHTLLVAPDNPAAENNLGVHMWELAEGTRGAKPDSEEKIREYRDKAIWHWRRAVEKRPTFSDALNNLGCALRHREQGTDDAAYKKRLEEAVSCFEAAIRYKPEHSDAHSNLALTLWDLKRPQEAMPHFAEALRLRPDHLDAKVTFAHVLAQMADDAAKEGNEELAQQRLEEAAGHLNEVTHLDEHNARAYEVLSRVCEMQARMQEAKGRTQESKRKLREANQAKNMAAWLMATSPRAAIRNGRAAVLMAQQVVNATAGQEPNSLDTLAAALAEVQKFSDAVNVAQRALAIANSKGDARLAAAIAARLELYKNKQPFRDEQPNVFAEAGAK
jgi:tetratricopeptide (TPR) repeat protein